MGPRLPTTSRRRASLAIAHENLEEKIYRCLRGLIVERQIRPGERVRVDSLAAEMGVSRTPVLHALKRLAQEGVVQMIPRRGIYVRRFTKREMARLFEVREVLEGLAARLAAARIDRPEVSRLARLFRRLDAVPPSTGLVRQYVERDRSLHSRIIELAGNDHLARAMESVNMMFFVYQDGLVRPPAETVPEHRALFAALGRGDPGASEAAMRRHIRRSIERLEAEAKAEELRDTRAAGPAASGRLEPRRPRAARDGRRESDEGSPDRQRQRNAHARRVDHA
ncbi:MAG TPA: GntR family transcriptional regulator [Candidatus Sulfotelmatobacter sp.]|nr:GntR family transcriptional regulator [Candidatus Sulfotelmatobacter sp.]